MERRTPARAHTDPSPSWTVAAAEAACSALIVLATTWYSVTHLGGVSGWLESLAPAWRGLITLATVLLAGGLLARAFARAEDALCGWRRAHLSGSGADE